MAMTTAQQMLDRYIQAELALLDGKTVQFGGRTLSMESLAEIRKGRMEWEQRVAAGQAARRGNNIRYSLADMQ
jgi:hypothetical protein